MSNAVEKIFRSLICTRNIFANYFTDKKNLNCYKNKCMNTKMHYLISVIFPSFEKSEKKVGVEKSIVNAPLVSLESKNIQLKKIK
jgi:hypothetical protein